MASPKNVSQRILTATHALNSVGLLTTGAARPAMGRPVDPSKYASGRVIAGPSIDPSRLPPSLTKQPGCGGDCGCKGCGSPPMPWKSGLPIVPVGGPEWWTRYRKPMPIPSLRCVADRTLTPDELEVVWTAWFFAEARLPAPEPFDSAVRRGRRVALDDWLPALVARGTWGRGVEPEPTWVPGFEPPYGVLPAAQDLRDPWLPWPRAAEESFTRQALASSAARRVIEGLRSAFLRGDETLGLWLWTGTARSSVFYVGTAPDRTLQASVNLGGWYIPDENALWCLVRALDVDVPTPLGTSEPVLRFPWQDCEFGESWADISVAHECLSLLQNAITNTLAILAFETRGMCVDRAVTAWYGGYYRALETAYDRLVGSSPGLRERCSLEQIYQVAQFYPGPVGFRDCEDRMEMVEVELMGVDLARLNADVARLIADPRAGLPLQLRGCYRRAP